MSKNVEKSAKEDTNSMLLQSLERQKLSFSKPSLVGNNP